MAGVVDLQFLFGDDSKKMRSQVAQNRAVVATPLVGLKLEHQIVSASGMSDVAFILSSDERVVPSVRDLYSTVTALEARPDGGNKDPDAVVEW